MTHPGTGLVLPSEVLTSNWFIFILTVVAFNTIIYVGLTLAKCAPLPKQIHPSRVRRWMRTLGMEPDRDTAADDVPRYELSDNPDPYQNMRREIARRTIPQAFGLLGALVIFSAMTTLIAIRPHRLAIHVVEFSFGVLFLACALVLVRRPFRAVTMAWFWSLACVLLFCLMTTEAVITHSEFQIAFAFIIMTAFAPVTLYWRPCLAGAALMLLALITASTFIANNDYVRLIIPGITALLVGMTLLQVRLTAVASLSDEKGRSEALVTTDVLTGTLTPHGLITAMPVVAGVAERTGSEVCVLSFCIEDLATANTQYGIHYGNDVLRAVAKGIAGVTRLGDLIARWEGDEFLVAGVGSKPNADELSRRVKEAVRMSDVNLGKWPTLVSVGTAAGDPRQTTFDQLLTEARAHRKLRYRQVSRR